MQITFSLSRVTPSPSPFLPRTLLDAFCDSTRRTAYKVTYEKEKNKPPSSSSFGLCVPSPAFGTKYKSTQAMHSGHHHGSGRPIIAACAQVRKSTRSPSVLAVCGDSCRERTRRGSLQRSQILSSDFSHDISESTRTVRRTPL